MCHVFFIKPAIRPDVKRASFFSRRTLIDGLFRVKKCQFGTGISLKKEDFPLNEIKEDVT